MYTCENIQLPTVCSLNNAKQKGKLFKIRQVISGYLFCSYSIYMDSNETLLCLGKSLAYNLHLFNLTVRTAHFSSELLKFGPCSRGFRDSPLPLLLFVWLCFFKVHSNCIDLCLHSKPPECLHMLWIHHLWPTFLLRTVSNGRHADTTNLRHRRVLEKLYWPQNKPDRKKNSLFFYHALIPIPSNGS